MSEIKLATIDSIGNLKINGGYIDERMPAIIGNPIITNTDNINDELIWYSPLDATDNQGGGRKGGALSDIIRYNFNTYPALANEFSSEYDGYISASGVITSGVILDSNYYGEPDSSYKFDASDDSYVTFNNNLFDACDDFTLGLTIKPLSVDATRDPYTVLHCKNSENKDSILIEITSSTELTVTIADGKAYSKFLSFTDTYTDVVICKDGEDIRIYSGDTGSTLNKLRMNLEPVLDPVEVISTRMGQSLDGDNQFLGNIADMFISAYTIPSSEETLVNYYVIKNPTDRQAAFKRTPPAFDFTVTPWGAEVYNEAGVVDLATSNKFFENEIHTYEQGDYRFISHHVDGENTRPFTYLHKNNYDYSYKGVDSFTSNSLDFFVGDKTKFIPDANAVPPLTIGRLYGTDIPSSTKCITISFWVYKYGCGYNVVDSFYGENEYRNIGSPTSYLRNPITLHNKDIVVGCHFGHRFISNMFHNDANFNLLLNNGWQKVSCTMPNLNHTEQDIFYVKYDPGAQNNHAHGSRFLITGIQIVLDKITTWYDCENYPGESVEVNPNINLIDSDVHTINGSYELDLLPVNSDFTIFGTFNSFENESGKSTDHIADGVLSYNVYTEDRDHYSLFNIVKSGDSNKKQVMFLDHCIDGATEESSYDFKIISDDMNTQTSQTLQSRKNLTFEKTVGPDSDKHGLSCATCSSLGSSFNNTDFTIALRMKQTYWWNGVDWGGTQGYYYIQQYLFSTMTDHASSGAGISLKINNPGNLADGFVLYLQNDAGATQPFYIPLYINHNNEDPILEWNHVVITFNNTTKELNFYLNGEEKLGGATWNNTITGGLQRDFVLGALNNFPSSTMWYNYNGYINDFAIWTEELSPSKVLELNNNVNTDHNTSSSSSNLETWWRMGDGPETKPTQDAVFSLAHDNSGNGNDLLLLARENDTASSPGLPSNGITAGPYWSVEYPGDSSDLVDLNIAKGSEHTFFLEQGAFGEEEINGVLTDWPNYVDTVYEGDSHYYKINDGHTLFYPNTSSDYILEDIDTSDIYKMSLDMRKEHSSYDCRQYVGLAYYDSLGTRIQKHEVYKKPNTYLEIDTGGYLTPINPGDGVRNMCTFKVDISNYDLGGDDSTRFGTFQEKWEYTRDLTGGKWGLYRTYLYAAFNTNPDPDPGSAWDNSDLPNRDVINLGNDLGDGAATDYELCDGGWAECNATDDVVTIYIGMKSESILTHPNQTDFLIWSNSSTHVRENKSGATYHYLVCGAKDLTSENESWQTYEGYVDKGEQTTNLPNYGEFWAGASKAKILILNNHSSGSNYDYNTACHVKNISIKKINESSCYYDLTVIDKNNATNTHSWKIFSPEIATYNNTLATLNTESAPVSLSYNNIKHFNGAYNNTGVYRKHLSPTEKKTIALHSFKIKHQEGIGVIYPTNLVENTMPKLHSRLDSYDLISRWDTTLFNSFTDVTFDDATINTIPVWGGYTDEYYLNYIDDNTHIISNVYDPEIGGCFIGHPYYNQIKSLGLLYNTSINDDIIVASEHISINPIDGPAPIFSWDAVYKLMPTSTQSNYYFKDENLNPLTFYKDIDTDTYMSFWYYYDGSDSCNFICKLFYAESYNSDVWIDGIAVSPHSSSILPNTWTKISIKIPFFGPIYKIRVALRPEDISQKGYVTAPTVWRNEKSTHTLGSVPPSIPPYQKKYHPKVYTNLNLELINFLSFCETLNSCVYYPYNLYVNLTNTETSGFYYYSNRCPQGTVGISINKTEYLDQAGSGIDTKALAFNVANETAYFDLGTSRNYIQVELKTTTDADNIKLKCSSNDEAVEIDSGKNIIDDYNVGDWINIIAVWNKDGIESSTDTIRLYLDGVLVGSSSSFTGIGYGDDSVVTDNTYVDYFDVGRESIYSGYTNAYIKNLFTVKRALTQVEINNIYNTRMSINSDKDLVIYDTLLEGETL